MFMTSPIPTARNFQFKKKFFLTNETRNRAKTAVCVPSFFFLFFFKLTFFFNFFFLTNKNQEFTRVSHVQYMTEEFKVRGFAQSSVQTVKRRTTGDSTAH